MKRTLTVLALVSGLGIGSHVFANEVKSHEQTVAVSEAYIPGGFSSDTEAYVVTSGMFPNSCYHFSRSEVSNSVVPMTHEIRLFATVAEDMCLMVLVPFSQEVRLGKLQTGEHTLRFVNGDGTYFERKLVVE